MDSRLIIIRGNSGSGKTTVAKRLQYELGHNTMLIPQDVLRREIIRVKDGPNNPSIQLIYEIAIYGNRIGYDVILEGILANKYYGEMVHTLIRNFNGDVFAYYFDISFEETLKRHNTNPNANDYAEMDLRQWWNDKDYLGIEQEKLFNHTQNEDQILQKILEDVPIKSSRPRRRTT